MLFPSSHPRSLPEPSLLATLVQVNHGSQLGRLFRGTQFLPPLPVTLSLQKKNKKKEIATVTTLPNRTCSQGWPLRECRRGNTAVNHLVLKLVLYNHTRHLGYFPHSSRIRERRLFLAHAIEGFRSSCQKGMAEFRQWEHKGSRTHVGEQRAEQWGQKQGEHSPWKVTEEGA